MKSAKVSFKGKIAFSEKFDDIYFNTDKPWSESEYVFATAIDEIWGDKDSFIVAEAGFGAGLNFLTLANKFKNSHKKLHFVSIEANPINTDDLAKIYKHLDVFKALNAHLIKLYPPLISGLHRIKFSPNITLDLCFGEINEMITELDFEADVWFMDGFAPSKNADMWSQKVFTHIARLTRLGGVVRTYSCARVVRDRFTQFGFELELREGYGKKRHMSHAILREKNIQISRPYFSTNGITQNLFTNKNLSAFLQNNYKVKKPTALIIGAGIAGLATAFNFIQNGFHVIIAEARDGVAQNGSGNVCGALMPLITQPSVALGRMHINAFLQAVRFYKQNSRQNLIKFNGCVEYAYDEHLYKRYAHWLQIQANEVLKFDANAKPYPAMFIKNGATVQPHKLCKSLARNFNILLNHQYKSHHHLKNGQISVKFKAQKSIKTDILIFATGSESIKIFKNLPISSVRGQVTHIKPLLNNDTPLSAKGYICPAINGTQIIGATYARNEYYDEPRDADNNENLSSVSEFLQGEKPQIMGAKVGYRSYSSDRFPIIGALHDETAYRQIYKNLFWNKHKNDNALAIYEPNVFVNIAHGSRGLSTAILGAELISDLILKRPLCIEKSLFDELHSARFLVRQLKRGQI
ncbi:bifunctional tRNA (5-methylaminomethyl-2-thiouridine)(34)-methyltransferase MnmD/FAD-dependent 5-carboxymethylaminomethyl-2-thiouridine(34) oxidoreductase MnmC [Campylobacter sp. faydin G-140]|uniref:bifunctional tRNA (5-methylaminomethyl-2-thiouridine)(34)-methyltransferase MnmD/FAD-dependent 5-carboxymethylaminomethyl-2-thiouridine(34) oxidoreductase MnmC n=1 Tax=Campylobacter anatolicus TaxID=2829105 RepID=UPI001B9835D9|nr:bifunctional tRNA (5-methylaminomethyl-2-thiouridine)(34)-methyltransferase MnmD/FAD-dependent 5-carboxymethylaminomethyl-2-thiouridine(34) oxidoreductase MnmC [Campylobacter anatolicus]MBR8465637.1 bifunctional tRNA (5-methylaminomethyl-2-thiouridine)(34)-methyltransferase MnmD/FAD-dependent 5-carboxymethylaminomethyl-2-thiouridine(34) oxidoreductase MnmC [Campylobacter anatolicus]